MVCLLTTAAWSGGFGSAAAAQAAQEASAAVEGTVSPGIAQRSSSPSGVPFRSGLPPFLFSRLGLWSDGFGQETEPVAGHLLSGGSRGTVRSEFPDERPGGSVRLASWDEALQFFGPGGESSFQQLTTGRNRNPSGAALAGSSGPGTRAILTADSRQESRGATDQQPAAPAVVLDEPPDVSAVTVEAIAAQKAAAEQVPDLPEDVRMRLAKHFQRATEQVQQKTDADRRTADFKAEREAGSAQLTAVREQLAEAPSLAEPVFEEGVPVAELEKQRQADDELAAEARRKLEVWETKASLRVERKPQMPALIEMSRQQLEEAKAALAAAPPEGELPLLTQARRLEQQTLVELLQSQLELLRAEQANYEALSELFPLQRDLLIRTRNHAEKRLQSWLAVLAEARRKESARQTEEAREKLRNAHPTLRTLAEANSVLTLKRKEVQEFLESKTVALQQTSSQLKSVEERFRRVQAKEVRAGLTTAIGLLLRSEKNQIPDAAQYRRRYGNVVADIVRLQAEQMQLEDQRTMLGDIASQVDLTLAGIQPTADQEPELRQMTQELLQDQRQYLDNLLADYDACLQTLGELDISVRSLESTADSFRDYVDERVLWIRSSQPLTAAVFSQTWHVIHQFWGADDWPRLFLFLVEDLSTEWPQYLLGLLLVFLIAGSQSRMRGLATSLIADRQRTGASLIPTMLITLALTMLTACAWPLIPGFAAWRLSYSNAPLATALQRGLTNWCVTLLVLDFFRRLCRRNGVAEACLEWPADVCRSLYRALQTYILLGIPLGFCVVVADAIGDGVSTDSLGRLGFLLRCLLLVVLLRSLLNPNGNALRDLLRANPESWIYRLRRVWYAAAVGTPILLAILASVGYLYTAQELMLRLQLTLVMAAAFTVAWTMLMKWLLEARRNLAIRQARARRAAAAAAQKDADIHGTPTSPVPPVEMPHVDISLLNQQMLALLRTSFAVLFLLGAWIIRSQVLPALQVVSRVELWPIVVTALERLPGADAESFHEVTRVEQVTLGDLLTAALVVSMAVLASRNMPALLELSILQRLPIEQGVRHAVITLCRYFVLLGCGLSACALVGIGWEHVQWMAAALTVGLGFGLQEIFANFVSGLIILFERPVRIGDIVTIDGVSGTVSRIRIRATTITDWDRRELIVPNKEFVTGKLLNWTLTDRVNRVVINVGVAYQTRTETALALLQQVADTHPLIMREPAPMVSFEGFGDSSLNLVLRCYLPNLDHRLKVVTELHAAIHERFTAEGIDIAFPQRDLHIRSLPAGLVPGGHRPASIAGTGPEAG